MKKHLLCFSVVAIFSVWGLAQPVLVYRNEADVKSGRMILGSLTTSGVVVPASQLIGSSTAPLVGYLSGDIFFGRVSRLDNDLDVALIRVEAQAPVPEFKKAHAERATAFKNFLPVQEGPSVSGGAAGVPVSTETFRILINGKNPAVEEVSLRSFRREAEATVEIVRLSTSPVWNIQVTIEATPAHSFWKKTDTRSLTQVPQKKLEFSQQFVFLPMKTGDHVKIPLQLSAIKESAYEWLVKIKTKQESWERTFPIKFE